MLRNLAAGKGNNNVHRALLLSIAEDVEQVERARDTAVRQAAHLREILEGGKGL